MASITSFQATRRNLFLPPLTIDYKPSPERCSSDASGDLARLNIQASKIDEFFQQQNKLLNCIKSTPRLKTRKELGYTTDELPSEDIKTSMINMHTIPLSKEQITHILNIANILREQQGVKESLNAPQRFKIHGSCSITLLEQETWIHLKKRELKHIIGFGGNNFTYRCIKADGDNNLSLVAELTHLYKTEEPQRDLSKTEVPLPESFKRDDFLLFPQTGYIYSGMKSGQGEKERFNKECHFYPRYDANFSSILTYDDQYNSILPPETKWKMLCFALKSIRIIHDAGFVFRDIKAENFLISFGKTDDGKSLDFGNCTFALANFELAIPESQITDKTKWLGTALTWPTRKEDFKETQKKPADIYALTVLFNQILAPIEDPNPALDSLRLGIEAMVFCDTLINQIKKTSPAGRPKIFDVIKKVSDFLRNKKPEYTWVKDYFPDV